MSHHSKVEDAKICPKSEIFTCSYWKPLFQKMFFRKGFQYLQWSPCIRPHITSNCHWAFARSIVSSSVVSTLERERAAKVPIQGVVRPTALPAGVAVNWTKEAEKSCWAARLSCFGGTGCKRTSGFVVLAGPVISWKIMTSIALGENDLWLARCMFIFFIGDMLGLTL